MNLFLVTFSERDVPSPLEDRAQRVFGADNLQKVSSSTLLIRSPWENPQLVSDSLNIDAYSPVVVFRLNGFYWGYHSQALWEWLEETRVKYG